MTKLFTVSVAVFFLTAALARGQQPHAYAIRCGKFIDGKGDRAQDNITIIVEGNIIRSGGKDVKIPAEAVPTQRCWGIVAVISTGGTAACN